VITYNGFYDLNLEWVGLDGVQIVASMNSTSSVGRHQLSSRFTSIVRIVSIGFVYCHPSSYTRNSRVVLVRLIDLIESYHICCFFCST